MRADVRAIQSPLARDEPLAAQAYSATRCKDLNGPSQHSATRVRLNMMHRVHGPSSGQSGHCLSSCRYVAGAPSRRAWTCVAHGKRRKRRPKESLAEDVPEMTEGVKASFYLRFCDVLGEDPSTAMRKIVDGTRSVLEATRRRARVAIGNCSGGPGG